MDPCPDHVKQDPTAHRAKQAHRTAPGAILTIISGFEYFSVATIIFLTGNSCSKMRIFFERLLY